MIFKNRCYNGGKQHCFEAVYNEETIVPDEITGITGRCSPTSFAEIIRASTSKKKTYIKHVCKWCGLESNKGS